MAEAAARTVVAVVASVVDVEAVVVAIIVLWSFVNSCAVCR